MASITPNTTSLTAKQRDQLTPAMRQWAEHKAQVGDAILLFRMGDFYETFFDDAETASRVLGLTLTKRDKATPLAGIPHHALDGYLARLVRAGYTVAISEQTEDPKQAKGIVRRDVVRIITPGTITEDSILPESSSNYLVALANDGERLGAACVDLAAGDYFTLLDEPTRLIESVLRLDPKEVLIADDSTGPAAQAAEVLHRQLGIHIARRSAHEFDEFHAERVLHEHFGVSTLEGFGYDALGGDLLAAGAALAYLKETQKTALQHIDAICRRDFSDHLHIDINSWRSLEVEQSLRTGSAEPSLYSAVNRTLTRMGARQLRHVLRFALRRCADIHVRQDAVADLVDDKKLLDDVRRHLRQICDIERITSRLGLARVSPRDLSALGRSLAESTALAARLRAQRCPLLTALDDCCEALHTLGTYLKGALAEEPPALAREGGVIADGFNADLDHLRSIGANGRQWLANYQAAESERTKIPSLKVGFNKVFGYYIEITNTHRALVPAHYVRKQTIKNAERYITDDLKQFENEVLTAQDKALELELQLFGEVMAEAGRYIPTLQKVARALAMIDVLAGFAEVAIERSYQRPQLIEDNELHIADGRHVVLDQILGHEFVPNDTHISAGESRVLIITGPNMAGKSTYIRQVALLTLLAQTGSFVPATNMRFRPVDRIFARVGASDELTAGQSTFMVEMIEAANILNNATADSLVILDELGRGTSTYDGLSLAWAICEHIALKINCRTLFATHYHELTELSHLLPSVKNYNVAVREWPGQAGQEPQIVFLHKILEGATDKSYGVHVARIAGVPPPVIEKSRQVLRHLESGLSRSSLREALTGRTPDGGSQLELFSVQDDRLRQELLGIDVNTLTPMDALQRLAQLQDEAR